MSRTKYGLTNSGIGDSSKTGSQAKVIVAKSPVEGRIIGQQAFNHGCALQQAGDLAGAEFFFRKAVSHAADHWEAYHALGLLACRRQQFDLAAEMIAKAVRLNSRSAELHNNMAAVRYALRQYAESAVASRKAIKLNSDFAPSHVNLGNALFGLEKIEDALKSYRRALAIQPNYELARFSLAYALKAYGRLDEAAAEYRELLRANPTRADVHNNLGNILQAQGRHMEAVECFKQSLALSPSRPSTHSNLAAAYTALGLIGDAIERYRESLRLAPDQPAVHSSLLLVLSYSARVSAQELFEEHRRFGSYADSIGRMRSARRERPDPPRRLRIGYVSADLRKHVVSYFIEPVLENHDRHRFEVFCYYNNLIVDDETRRMQRLVAHWRPIAALSDDAAAQLIRSDEIDVLVDLSGHTAGNRLLVFARRPAPVQVTWLGYLGTTGMSTMDYRLTDENADPPGAADALHTEKLVRLPDSLWCYRPDESSPDVGELPAAANGFVTFGAFHSQAKVNQETMSQWARVLIAVRRSRLLLIASSQPEALLEAFVRLGVSNERVRIVERQPFVKYLRLHHEVDVGLDTFPYSGGTTTFHSLWMGVPVLTRIGETSASRSSASILSTLGLDNFIADSPDTLVANAVHVAKDCQGLSDLRSRLRDMVKRTSLANSQQFTRNLEKAYLEMHSEKIAASSLEG